MLNPERRSYVLRHVGYGGWHDSCSYARNARARAHKEVASPAVPHFALRRFLRMAQVGVTLGQSAEHREPGFAYGHIVSHMVIDNMSNDIAYLHPWHAACFSVEPRRRCAKCATSLGGTPIALSPGSRERHNRVSLLTSRPACLPWHAPIVDNRSATAMALPLHE